MPTSKLKIYNGALAILGQRALASTSENRESRRQLDLAWDDGAVDDALEAGQWYFAMRSVRLTYDPSIDPDWGHKRVFEVPDDHIRTCAVCADEMFTVPILAYKEEAGFWYGNLDTIYVRYVSNDAQYGGDMSLWPGSFVEFLKGTLAFKSGMAITQDAKRVAGAEAFMKEALKNAKSKAAMADPSATPAQGRWTQARQGQSRSWPDRGNQGSLIG